MFLRLRIAFLSQDFVDGGTGDSHPPSELRRAVRVATTLIGQVDSIA